jgi:Zn ribbon nucleic-acid-binding protein
MLRLNSYEASSLSDHVAPYRCVHCGYQTTARAFAFATGTGLSPYGVDDNGAEARAARYAIAKGRARAEQAIRMAPCPRCHRRDRAPLWAAYRSTLLVSALIVIGAMVLFTLPHDVQWRGGVFLGLFFGGPCGLLYWRHKTSQLTSRQVRFDDPVEAEAALAASGGRMEGAAELPAARLKRS